MLRRAGALFCLISLAGFAPTTVPVAAPPASQPASRPTTQPSLIPLRTGKAVHAPYVLYLPGISAFRSLDRGMIRGLVDSGLDATIETYDWPAYNAGLGALLNEPRNRYEARRVAAILLAAHAKDPARPIYILSHSGGCGIAAWAIEQLPADVRIEQLVMLAPALSPEFDLTGTLSHVSGRLYCFSSPADPVLGSMVSMFGTIDRVNSEAAGLRGFIRPPAGDAAQYQKLTPMPYDPAWMALGNPGDHIGPLSRRFSQSVLAPLLVRGR